MQLVHLNCYHRLPLIRMPISASSRVHAMCIFCRGGDLKKQKERAKCRSPAHISSRGQKAAASIPHRERGGAGGASKNPIKANALQKFNSGPSANERAKGRWRWIGAWKGYKWIFVSRHRVARTKSLRWGRALVCLHYESQWRHRNPPCSRQGAKLSLFCMAYASRISAIFHRSS